MTDRRICFICDALFPFEWTDHALNMAFRALAAAAAGDEVVLLHQVVQPLPRSIYQQATSYYQQRGVSLMISQRIGSGLPRDLKVMPRQPSAPGVILHHRLLKQQAGNPYAELHVSAHSGLALRLLQAQQAGLGFEDCKLSLHLDQLETADCYFGRRRQLRERDLTIQFYEAECLRLATDVICLDDNFSGFLEHQFALPIPRVNCQPLEYPTDTQEPFEEIASRAVLLVNQNEGPLLADYTQLATAARRRGVFSVLAPASRRRALDEVAKQEKLAAHFAASAIQVINQLRANRAVVIAPTPWYSPTIHWLTSHGIPVVFARSGEFCAIKTKATEQNRSFTEGRNNELLAALQHCWSGDSPQPEWSSGKRKNKKRATTKASRIQTGEQLDTPVTVAVSHYNLGTLMQETLDCLQAQDYPHQNVVVVDDGSTDAEALEAFHAYIERYPQFTFVELPHEGYWSPRNHVVETTADPFIIIVDGDNLPVPEMTSDFCRALQRNPRADAFSCYITSFADGQQDADGELVFKATNYPSGSDLLGGLRRNVFGDTNAIFRTKVIRKLGGYRANFDNPYADWDIFMRLAAAGYRHEVLPKVLLHYRSHTKSMIRQRNTYLSETELLSLHDPTTWKTDPATRRRLARALHNILT